MSKSNKATGRDRYNFLLPFIGYVVQNSPVEIATVANHFGVDEKFVRDAVTTLTVTATQRAGGGEDCYYNFAEDLLEEGIISITQTDGIDAAPRLSGKQASALAAGLSILASLPEFSSQSEIKELLEIIARGSTVTGPPVIDFRPGSVDADAAVIRHAMLNNHRIQCEYRNLQGEQSIREIDPIRLDPRGDIWFLKGYCLKNKELRNFRLDHMRKAIELDVEISEDAKNIQEIDDAEYIANETDIEVTVEVDPEAYSVIGDFAAEIIKRDEKNAKVTALIKIGYLPYLGKVIAHYGGAARVIAPESARKVVREYALTALGKPIDELPKDD
jgi:proteasome accessory factor C